MAEFKISRIRYTWKGDWSTGISFNRDDVVQYGASSWVCIRKHTSSTFNSDQTFLANPGDTEASPAWIKMTGGRRYRGEWTQSRLYNEGDIFKYGGSLYLTVNLFTSTSVFENGLPNLAIYLIAINWRGDWAQNTNYGLGDLVRYGGQVYKCILTHTSSSDANGPEVGNNDALDDSTLEVWEIYYSNLEFKGSYQSGIRYKINDVILYNGSLLRCIETYSSNPGFDNSKWTLEADGNEFESDWASNIYYGKGSVVRSGGYLFYATVDNYNKQPNDSIYQSGIDAPWQILSENYNFRGAWSRSISYKTGDVVRRGGYLYKAILDTTDDGSSLDYLDSSNWEPLISSQRWRNFWAEGQLYGLNDVVIFLGSTYLCNVEHISSEENFPGDNGSGFEYWDLLLRAGSQAGLIARGDLLTYNLSRGNIGDGSTLGDTRVPIGVSGTILSINDEDDVIYKNYGNIARVFYVDLSGVDNISDSQSGISQFKPWRTIRFACEQANDGFAGTTTIKVGAGKYEEVLPIVVPKNTVVLGTELRTTTIEANAVNTFVSITPSRMIEVLTRISQIIQAILAGEPIDPPKTTGNLLEPVVVQQQNFEDVPFIPAQFDLEGNEIFNRIRLPDTQALAGDQTPLDIQDLIENIQDYIDFYINSTGSNPTLAGTNTASTDQEYINASLILEANKEFIIAESVAFIRNRYPSYDFNEHFLQRDIRRFVDAWKYDIIYTGNYKTLQASRFYRNTILGSQNEDMFYVRDSTGVRNCTLNGLAGTLNPPLVADIYRLPTGGSYVSLDPGWGPDDNTTWITARSPYIQGVTTFGTGCIGQKIDGNLHSGGNKSITSNDFTQVISDGIGAWVTNNGRAELVSVFTYYAHIGYLATAGGIIRATNGNCSYGRFGAVADGIDLTEVPQTAVTYTRAQQAIVASAFAGDFTDEIQILEWANAGEDYTSATATFVGAGASADVLFEEFRDDAVFEVRRVDVGTGINQEIGGSGYVVIQNNAQTGTETTITIAQNDPNSIGNYLGMRIILTSGPGTGQYAYITGYDNVTKLVTVARESDDQPGWDHVIPGKPVTVPLTTGTTYRIEPRVIFSEPEFAAVESTVPLTTNWVDITYGETTETYLNLTAGPGTGTVVEDDGLVPVEARFNVTKIGRNYTISIANPGAGYEFGQELIISGDQLGGETPLNDLTILITEISNDSTNSIVTAEQKTFGTGEDNEAASGRFVAISTGGSAAVWTDDGINWTSFNMPTSGDWSSITAGNNRFVAVRRNSNSSAYSLDGKTWFGRPLVGSREWNAVTYGGGVFVAVAGNQDSAAFSTNGGETWLPSTLPDIGDSSFNEWVDIAYGKNTFVALSNSGNFVATGVYDSSSNSIVWTGRTMDVIADSSNKSWQSVAYGNNRFVAVSSEGDIGYSFDGVSWLPATMPSQDGSTAHNWKKIRYGQGVFFAIGDTGFRPVGGDATAGPSTFAATSFDGIVWANRELANSSNWTSIAFGNPYVESRDSTIGKKTPMWIAIADNTNTFNKIQAGTRALGRVTINSGVISQIRIWDPGSGYAEAPQFTLVDPNNTADVAIECRMGDGVLTNPSWLNRGIGYRSNSTTVTISGNGFADVTPAGKFIVINDLDSYPGPGAQMTIQGLDELYTLVTVTPIGPTDRGIAALVRVSPEIRNRDNLQHLVPVTIRSKFSQCRITGHDFLDIGTGNFEETNYPELYSGFYTPAPENEVVEEDGGRVFYVSTDQSGNFRCGELFAVEQATGTVTISADFFDFSGLTELRLGGIRVGGTGAVIREFSTDPLFTEDSNNVVPTQRAISAYLSSRLSVGGSSISVGSFIAGTISVGPNSIGNAASISNVVPVVANFEGSQAGISGSLLGQYMFYKSF